MLFGAIDVGTNSIHLIVVEFDSTFDTTCVGVQGPRDGAPGQQRRDGARPALQQGDGARGRRSVRFVDAARARGAERIRAVATSAVREAENGNTGDRMKYWGKVGAFWGGFWGLLFGSAMFVIPVLGPILVAVHLLVAWIVAGLEGAVEVGAFGALGAGLFSIGIPKDSIVKYQTALTTDQFLLIAHGTCRSGQGEGHHRKHESSNLHTAYGRSSRGLAKAGLRP